MEYSVLIKNKNILITGTSKGIGNFLAKKFLKSGNNVWGCSRTNKKINHKNYFHQKIDLNNEIKISQWITKILKGKNFHIDVLINNAATYEKNLSYFQKISDIKRSFKVNAMAPILLTNLISKDMIKNRKGLIIFFSSVATILNEPGTSLYASSKSSLETYARIIKREFKGFKIKVSIIRIQYLKTTLSKFVNKKKRLLLRKKFSTNKINSKEKLYKEINRIFEKKNPPVIISDKPKNEKIF